MDLMRGIKVAIAGGDDIGFIEGRYRDFMGKVQPQPNVRWVPWRPSDEGTLGARIQIHHIYALEDSIAFHTRQYDIVDGELVESFVDYYDPNRQLVSQYSTNKIYLRNDRGRCDDSGLPGASDGKRSLPQIRPSHPQRGDVRLGFSLPGG